MKESGMKSASKRIIIGISGASGVIYGVRMLHLIKEKGFEVHLILSEAAKRNIEIETDYDAGQLAAMADYTYDNRDVGAAVASGSFITNGMVVVPCTIKTLSGVANSYTENLIVRAADVTLKEGRKLVLVVRETPFHAGHLRLMSMVAECGGVILPPIPAFYHQPKSVDEIINQTIGKILDCFDIEHSLFRRWGSDIENGYSKPQSENVNDR